jgi:hypothetical protein
MPSAGPQSGQERMRDGLGSAPVRRDDASGQDEQASLRVRTGSAEQQLPQLAEVRLVEFVEGSSFALCVRACSSAFVVVRCRVCVRGLAHCAPSACARQTLWLPSSVARRSANQRRPRGSGVARQAAHGRARIRSTAVDCALVRPQPSEVHRQPEEGLQVREHVLGARDVARERDDGDLRCRKARDESLDLRQDSCTHTGPASGGQRQVGSAVSPWSSWRPVADGGAQAAGLGG